MRMPEKCRNNNNNNNSDNPLTSRRTDGTTKTKDLFVSNFVSGVTYFMGGNNAKNG